MLRYTELKRDRQKFLTFTGLTLKEFKSWLPAFTAAYRCQYESHQRLIGRKRERKVGGGRRGRLDTIEQKLLFILVYQKVYPHCEHTLEARGVSQSHARRQHA